MWACVVVIIDHLDATFIKINGCIVVRVAHPGSSKQKYFATFPVDSPIFALI